MVRTILCKSAIGLAGLAVLPLPAAADARDFSLKLEPGVTIPLTKPQSQIYDVGASLSLKALFGLTPYLDIGPTVSFTGLAAAQHLAESGLIWAVGGGLRAKAPRTADSSRFSPWGDADLFYTRTGDLNRAGFDLAAGLAMGLGDAREYWVGPFVRYMQVIQPKRDGYDNSDAKLLTIGLSVEFGSGIERAREASAPVAESPPREVVREVCSDRDQDGVPDSVDRCPDVAGTTDSWGCPAYERVVVKPDKLELKEHIYFAYNSAELDSASHPALDEVVQALKDNKDLRVQIEGHADSSGSDALNQPLSERRAEAVKSYLVAHGIAQERLSSKGFSSSVPTGNNKTIQGREDNRRVQFVVHFNILNDGSSK
ncbi:MAG: OmpA-like Outer rane domain protein [Myxococcaceae bacterium]|nr:OmpA-like Outer rane domain protein [Myxococcaceae bacterium]